MEHEKKYWSKNAKHYDVESYLLNENIERVIEKVAELIPPRSKILEVGCGTGLFTASVARKAEKVVAVDISEPMLTKAKKRIRDLGMRNVQFHKADAFLISHLGKFDVVLAANLLPVIPNPRDFLSIVSSVLRKNGLVIAPTYLHGKGFFARLSSWILRVKKIPLHTRFDQNSCLALFSDSSLKIESAEVFKGLLPIFLVVARKKNEFE